MRSTQHSRARMRQREPAQLQQHAREARLGQAEIGKDGGRARFGAELLRVAPIAVRRDAARAIDTGIHGGPYGVRSLTLHCSTVEQPEHA
jgi:hypothetical protein